LAFFDFQKKPSALKKQNFKIRLQNCQISTLHTTSDCLRPLLLGRRNCCVTRSSGFGPSARKIVWPVWWFACNSWRITWFYLNCRVIISCEHVRFPSKLLPNFHTFCSPASDFYWILAIICRFWKFEHLHTNTIQRNSRFNKWSTCLGAMCFIKLEQKWPTLENTPELSSCSCRKPHGAESVNLRSYRLITWTSQLFRRTGMFKSTNWILNLNHH